MKRLEDAKAVAVERGGDVADALKAELASMKSDLESNTIFWKNMAA